MKYVLAIYIKAEDRRLSEGGGGVSKKWQQYEMEN